MILLDHVQEPLLHLLWWLLQNQIDQLHWFDAEQWVIVDIDCADYVCGEANVKHDILPLFQLGLQLIVLLLHLHKCVVITSRFVLKFIIVFWDKAAQYDLKYTEEGQIVLDSFGSSNRAHHVLNELNLSLFIDDEIGWHQLSHEIMKFLSILRQMHEFNEPLYEKFQIHIDGDG